MHGLKTSKILKLNRKALSNMAIEDKEAFSQLIAQVKNSSFVIQCKPL